MSLIRISESDNWIADYDRGCGMYRVSYFEDGHFVDEHWFDCYEEKEVTLPQVALNYILTCTNNPPTQVDIDYVSKLLGEMSESEVDEFLSYCKKILK